MLRGTVFKVSRISCLQAQLYSKHKTLSWMTPSMIGIVMMTVAMATAMASIPVAQSFTHIVGGPAGWTFGSNYADWANITAAEPGFFNNDVLLFKYENAPPVHHNVYLFKDFAHYQACDFSEATLLANSTQGTAPGFEYKLPERGWYHFGCSVPAHCTEGLMKFRIKAKHHSKPAV